MAANDVEIFKKADFINDFYFVIEDKKQNIVGIIVAVRITSTDIDVSYYLAEEYRHNGYMYEAIKYLVYTIRKEKPEYHFQMVIDIDNRASLNVMKKLQATIQVANNKYICYV